MKLIIEIDEDRYDKNYLLVKNGMGDDVHRAVANGTPLPKEYGDLVDRDAINNRYNAIYDELTSLSNQPTHKELLDKLSMCLDTSEPIIKGNYEEAEEELWR